MEANLVKRANHVRKIFAPWLFFLAAAFFCHSALALEGQVLNADTGSPIPGAIVVVRWTATVGGAGGGHSTCKHVETATADANGHYRISVDYGGWYLFYTFLTFDKQVEFSAYKFWYVMSEKHPSSEEKIYLEPFRGSEKEWLAGTDGGYFYCASGAGSSDKNLYRLYASKLRDAEALVGDRAKVDAETADDMQILRLNAASALIDYSKPYTYVQGYPKNIDPNDEFKKEDLLK